MLQLLKVPSSQMLVEANSYFHQMFSGNLSIEAMIQMLTRFKGSSDKREQSIYESMIANLFEEYQNFFLVTHLSIMLANVSAFNNACECVYFLKDVQIGDQNVSGNHFPPSGSSLNIYI